MRRPTLMVAWTQADKEQCVPRLTRSAQATGDLRVLLDALHELHERAGLPSLSDMERMVGAGVASRSRIHEAFSRPRLPNWGLIDVLVEQLSQTVPSGPPVADEIKRFHHLWMAASRNARSISTTTRAPAQNSRVLRDAMRLGLIGSAFTALAFNRMGWIYSEQPHDYGIDGVVQPINGRGDLTGRLLAIIIKCGASYFRERRDGKIIYRDDSRHMRYWSEYQIPVILVLVDPDEEVAYWVRVAADSVTRGGDRWRLAIPDDQLLNNDSAERLYAATLPSTTSI